MICLRKFQGEFKKTWELYLLETSTYLSAKYLDPSENVTTSVTEWTCKNDTKTQTVILIWQEDCYLCIQTNKGKQIVFTKVTSLFFKVFLPFWKWLKTHFCTNFAFLIKISSKHYFLWTAAVDVENRWPRNFFDDWEQKEVIRC